MMSGMTRRLLESRELTPPLYSMFAVLLGIGRNVMTGTLPTELGDLVNLGTLHNRVVGTREEAAFCQGSSFATF